MAKLKVIKKTEEEETSNMDDKKPGVARKTYIPNPTIYNPKLESTTNIDTAGYAAGAKKFPKVKVLEATGKPKEGMAIRKADINMIKMPLEEQENPPKVKILEAKGKLKEGMAKRKEVDRAIKNPVSVAFGPSGYSANDMVNIKKRIIESDKKKEISESNKEK